MKQQVSLKLEICWQSLEEVTMDEGIAHIFLVSKNTTKLKSKIEKTISKNKAFGSKTQKQKNKFFS